MQHKASSYFALALSCIALSSCKSNTAFTRQMAGLTTEYNIYFNGNEAYKRGLADMEQSVVDDYSQQLPLHPVYALANAKEPVPNASFDRTIEKCKKAVQTKSISTKPKRKERNDKAYREWLTHGEWNPKLHKAWILNGKAQFFKGDFSSAQATFAYTIRHFWWLPQAIAECHIWTARCHAVQGFTYEAEAELAQVHDINSLPRTLQREYSLTQAEILLQKNTLLEKIPELLTTAHSTWLTKEQRSRALFLKAQIYERLGSLDQAYNTYAKVARNAHNYRVRFNARIAQTRVMELSQIGKIQKKLTTWQHQKRNAEYLDQILYALGNLELQQKDTASAINLYEQAVEKSTRNGIEKGIAALRLGEVTFAQHDYSKAQKAYSTALALINENYPGYSQYARISEVLDQLQTHTQTILMQDSLLSLAALPPAELELALAKAAKAELEAEKEEARKEHLNQFNDRLSENTDPLAQDFSQPEVGEKDDSWYFYNPSAITRGKATFQRLWGNRKLEDNWRRRNKTEVYFANEDNAEDPDTVNIETPQVLPDSLSQLDRRIAILRQNLPLSPAQKQAANSLIETSMYETGVILNEKLNDFDQAISAFNRLETRYPSTQYRINTYYYIYLMYMRMGQTDKAEVYRQKLLTTFPASQYAKALSSPHYIDDMRKMEAHQDSLYNQTYELYLANQSQQVHQAYDWVSQNWPTSKLMPKFLFLHALSFVQEGQSEQFREALEQLTALYPNSDVSPLASQIVKGIHQGRNIQGGETAKSINWNTTETNDSLPLDSTMLFIAETEVPHLLLLAFNPGEIVQNDLLFDVAKFNFENYLIRDFDLEIIGSNEFQVLVISKFRAQSDLQEYRRRMSMSQTLHLPESIKAVGITEDNFRKMLTHRSLSEYLQWLTTQKQ